MISVIITCPTFVFCRKNALFLIFICIFAAIKSWKSGVLWAKNGWKSDVFDLENGWKSSKIATKYGWKK